MNFLLADALRELALQPGQARSVTVDDYEVEVRRPGPLVHDMPSGEIRRPEFLMHDEGPMVNIFLNAPPSPNAITFVALKRTRILPDPIVITEDDLAPGDLGSKDGSFPS